MCVCYIGKDEVYKINTSEVNIDLQFMITLKVKQNLVQDIHMHLNVY